MFWGSSKFGQVCYAAMMNGISLLHDGRKNYMYQVSIYTLGQTASRVYCVAVTGLAKGNCITSRLETLHQTSPIADTPPAV